MVDALYLLTLEKTNNNIKIMTKIERKEVANSRIDAYFSEA